MRVRKKTAEWKHHWSSRECDNFLTVKYLWKVLPASHFSSHHPSEINSTHARSLLFYIYLITHFKHPSSSGVVEV